MNAMIRQAQKMQDEISELQEDIESRDFTATAGGGAVSVTVTGKKTVKALEIKPEVVDPEDIEMLQDLIISAVNEAVNPAVSGSLAESSAYVAGNNLLIVAKNRFFLTLLKNKENALSLRETVKQFLGAEYNIRAKCSEPEEQTSKAQNLLQKAMDSHLDTAVEE